MTLPDFLEKVPKSIIRRVGPGYANFYRIIPYAVLNNPIGLLVAIEQGLSDRGKRDLEGSYRQVTEAIISVGEEITRDEMDEALERYYP